MILIQRQSRRLQGSTIGNKKRERSSFQSEKFAFDIGELWCSTGHSSQALVAEQIVGKKGRAAKHITTAQTFFSRAVLYLLLSLTGRPSSKTVPATMKSVFPETLVTH
jgi:hypothetical protein